MKLLSWTVAVASSALLTGPSAAHEFWLSPEDFTLAPGDTLNVDLVVGQRFEGPPAPYIPANFTRFDIVTGGEGDPSPVEGRIGDRPALQMQIDAPGLATVLHVSRDYELEWDDWDAFVAFTEHKDAGWVPQAHVDRGLEAAGGVVEGYSRHAKSILAVGDGAGQDRAYGLETEIVALENPYTGDMDDGLDVRLLYRGEVRADAQVEIFARGADGGVAVSTVRTNADGVATVPVSPGETYLLDAVVMREAASGLVEAFGAQWESLWASLTFAVPAG